ncbi:hypothetical protein P43SY_004396 [Pythium insidiosum]|uniref:Cystatin domain-containing protein n=1 Tax=Pythium insidiosum TaxID=114742 RepID=A0AAD5LSP9_PYTIN|nr:hypothetical protein P43SY_004396 [Pythium insidiosum]
MMKLLSFLAIALAFCAGAAADDSNNSTATPQPLGGFHPAAVGPKNIEDLLRAMSRAENYHEDVKRPICIVQVKRVQVQVVSGVKYLFEAEGCPAAFDDAQLGNCDDEKCPTPSKFELEVYVEPWTDTYKVERIARLE